MSIEMLKLTESVAVKGQSNIAPVVRRNATALLIAMA